MRAKKIKNKKKLAVRPRSRVCACAHSEAHISKKGANKLAVKPCSRVKGWPCGRVAW